MPRLDRVLRTAARLVGRIPRFGRVSGYMPDVLHECRTSTPPDKSPPDISPPDNNNPGQVPLLFRVGQVPPGQLPPGQQLLRVLESQLLEIGWPCSPLAVRPRLFVRGR